MPLSIRIAPSDPPPELDQQYFGPNRPARVGREPVFRGVSQNSPPGLGGLGTRLWDTRAAASSQVAATSARVSQ